MPKYEVVVQGKSNGVPTERRKSFELAKNETKEELIIRAVQKFTTTGQYPVEENSINKGEIIANEIKPIDVSESSDIKVISDKALIREKREEEERVRRRTKGGSEE